MNNAEKVAADIDKFNKNHEYGLLKAVRQLNSEYESLKLQGACLALKDKIKATKNTFLSETSDKNKRCQAAQKLSKEVELWVEKCNIQDEQKIKVEGQLREFNILLQEQKETLKILTEKSKKVEEDAKDRIQLYSTNLGLEILNTKEGIVFQFTQISSRDPQKKFLMILSVQEDVYKIGASHPQIENLKELVAKLNATDNLTGFLVHLRNLFIKMSC